jgi:hypothetical protein
MRGAGRRPAALCVLQTRSGCGRDRAAGGEASKNFYADAGGCTQNTRMGLSPAWSFTAATAAAHPGEPRQCGSPCPIGVFCVHLPAFALSPCLLRHVPHAAATDPGRCAPSQEPMHQIQPCARKRPRCRQRPRRMPQPGGPCPPQRPDSLQPRLAGCVAISRVGKRDGCETRSAPPGRLGDPAVPGLGRRDPHPLRLTRTPAVPRGRKRDGRETRPPRSGWPGTSESARTPCTNSATRKAIAGHRSTGHALSRAALRRREPAVRRPDTRTAPASR